MKRTFIEATDFQKKLESLNETELLQGIQNAILRNPEIGVLIKGTGGIRKFRFGTMGRGKSGGLRVFYLDVPLKEKCYLLFMIEKTEAGNISHEEKNELKQLSQLLKSKRSL